jgi:hypothetical protein
MTRTALLTLSILLLAVTSCDAESSDTTVASATTAAGNTSTVEVTGSTGTCDLPGEVLTCQVESSDDRTSGIAEVDVSCDLTEDGDTTLGVCSGPATITNDGGTWEGMCDGTTTWSASAPAHVHDFECTYVGFGAYAGLRYVEHLEGVDYPWTITGLIETVE